MKLADAKRSLMKAKDSASERLRQLEEERVEIKASIRSLDAAIRALDVNRNRNTKPTQKKDTAPLQDFADDDTGIPESH